MTLSQVVFLTPDSGAAEPLSHGNDCVGMKSTSLKLLTCLILSLLVASACDGPSEPTFEEEQSFGSLEITTVTTGTMRDADGYVVSIDEGNSEPIGINQTVTFGPITVRRYDVNLTEVAGNCTVSGSNPRAITVTAGDATPTLFEVVCS